MTQRLSGFQTESELIFLDAPDVKDATPHRPFAGVPFLTGAGARLA